MPTASISSMKTMHWPPHLRASFFALRASQRTITTFMGMDVVIVRWLARKAKKLARKWGGQCIVFIDEIDAVGMRRQSLGPAGGFATPLPATRFEELAFYGPNGSLTASGDLILETRAWRDRLFAARAPEPRQTFLGRIVNQMPVPGMAGGGQLALNQ